MLDAVVVTLDNLDVAATIYYKDTMWRQGKTNLPHNIPTPKVFPTRG